MRFDHCLVTNAICGPSRACLLTGKYSHRNGFYRNGNRFDGTQNNFAKILQKGGYRTAVIGKWHLASDPTGFDHWKILYGQGTYYNPKMKTADGDNKYTSPFGSPIASGTASGRIVFGPPRELAIGQGTDRPWNRHPFAREIMTTRGRSYFREAQS